jgi:Protein of unknown function (DUF2510)
MSSLPPAGWYPNPSGAPGQRFFDGRDWTAHHRAAPPQPMGAPPHPAASPQPLPMQTSVVVTGPNHALHAVLTLLTFWACGGWAWIWLIVALSNRRRVHMVTTAPPSAR